jgi:hypothetical protein
LRHLPTAGPKERKEKRRVQKSSEVVKKKNVVGVDVGV